jgi:ribosomal-protein-serine acetyltransferase
MKPILLDFPEAFETERLLIRCPLRGDGRAVNEAILESVESMKSWLPFVDPLPSIEDSEENVLRAQAKFITREDLRLLLFHRESGRLIGSSGLHRINWGARRFEIGYWLRDSETRKGYMVEAVNGITRYAEQFLNAQRIEIRCDARNERSAKVAERCGFYLEATLRHQTLAPDGEYANERIYTKVRLSDGRLGYR